jgi:hypothetical protein
MRRTATRRRPRTSVEAEGRSREKKVFRFFRWASLRKGSSRAGEEDREGGGRERDLTASLERQNGREQSRLWVRQRMLGTSNGMSLRG